MEGSPWGALVDGEEGCDRVRRFCRIGFLGVEVVGLDGSGGWRGCQEEVDG